MSEAPDTWIELAWWVAMMLVPMLVMYIASKIDV
jgi:hypothetical protein